MRKPLDYHRSSGLGRIVASLQDIHDSLEFRAVNRKWAIVYWKRQYHELSAQNAINE